MPETESIAAEIATIRWRAEDDGFAVVAAVAEDGSELTLTGPIAHLREGDTVRVQGAWQDHPKFGRQLYVEQVKVAPPRSADAVLGLLESIQHVGPKGAQWLMDRHGDEVLDVVDRDPGARLREVPGIGRTKLKAAVASWHERSDDRALRSLLAEHDVPAAAATRVAKALGAGAIGLLREDPYALMQVDGISFLTADTVARAFGIAPDAHARVAAGLNHALRSSEQEGHCYLPREELLTRTARLLTLPASTVDAYVEGAGLVLDAADRVIHPRMDHLEHRLAERVREMVAARPALGIKVPEDPPLTGSTSPTAEQWAAVRIAAEHRLSILTGLPGTGKTTTMRALVELLRSKRRTVKLCAPTGKAAKRLSESTGAEATTIHRLLEWVPGEGFGRDAEDPLTGVDLLVVDEASMLDLRLAAAVFDAVGTRTHVLLVGDVDQLAPIGPGRVLEDLIASDIVPSTHLVEVFRQAARSLIIRAAHAIDQGERPTTVADEDDIRDFFYIERPTADLVVAEVLSLATTRLPGHYGLDATQDLQVLTPMHRGVAGITAFNDQLRAVLNPEGRSVRGTSFRVGDRVMQTRNNHERSFYNGEIGVIVATNPVRKSVTIACDDGRQLKLDNPELGTLRLAYACSVHKMQGSQAPAIVIALTRAHAHILTRNLLYTAVTRAQTTCVVVAETDALSLALARVDASRRNTRLVELVA